MRWPAGGVSKAFVVFLICLVTALTLACSGKAASLPTPTPTATSTPVVAASGPPLPADLLAALTSLLFVGNASAEVTWQVSGSLPRQLHVDYVSPDRLRILSDTGDPALRQEVILIGSSTYYRFGSTWYAGLPALDQTTTLPVASPTAQPALPASVDSSVQISPAGNASVGGKDCKLYALTGATLGGAAKACISDGLLRSLAWDGVEGTKVSVVMDYSANVAIEKPLP